MRSRVYDVYNVKWAQKSSELSISHGHISQGITRVIPYLAPMGGIWVFPVDSEKVSRSLWCGRFVFTILLHSTAIYRESIVVHYQHYSQVTTWNQSRFLPRKSFSYVSRFQPVIHIRMIWHMTCIKHIFTGVLQLTEHLRMGLPGATRHYRRTD